MDYETMYLQVSELCVEQAAEIRRLKQRIENLENPQPKVVEKVVYKDRPAPRHTYDYNSDFSDGLIIGGVLGSLFD